MVARVSFKVFDEGGFFLSDSDVHGVDVVSTKDIESTLANFEIYMSSQQRSFLAE